jgi:hypothetical protein
MQNYFQFDNKFFQPNKGIAMGSPISDTEAEILLQYYKDSLVKNNLENTNIKFYNRYVDDILIIYDEQKTTADTILSYMNTTHNHLKFKHTDEENQTISFLDLLITRNQDHLNINIYQKPTTTDTTIHYYSSHPVEHKYAAFRFLLNRLHQSTSVTR